MTQEKTSKRGDILCTDGSVKTEAPDKIEEACLKLESGVGSMTEGIRREIDLDDASEELSEDEEDGEACGGKYYCIP